MVPLPEPFPFHKRISAIFLKSLLWYLVRHARRTKLCFPTSYFKLNCSLSVSQFPFCPIAQVDFLLYCCRDTSGHKIIKPKWKIHSILCLSISKWDAVSQRQSSLSGQAPDLLWSVFAASDFRYSFSLATPDTDINLAIQSQRAAVWSPTRHLSTVSGQTNSHWEMRRFLNVPVLFLWVSSPN